MGEREGINKNVTRIPLWRELKFFSGKKMDEKGKKDKNHKITFL
jgi:hypothetical protein